ncbi:PREDICTED: alpha-2C adrenergic receptor-like [Priapulus caudatus]|uniref:Alpha-2C adrenergic receptor-like n=1 Tax=Priapulus caudatus TaxID=37621 RepID=A0ABM1F9E8_PRICU|nr:PREDICTED: alpha-2C adrenergic receptor-like [Priapulus caudatus]
MTDNAVDAPPTGNLSAGNLTCGHDSFYPSCFSQSRIILTALFVTLLMLFMVVGNIMVVIAIAREKSLKQVQNWFLASLAMADMFIGGLIVPFTLAQELMGYWYFSVIWCEIWKALDVLLCTASTLSLCAISLDRYWSITQAVKYVQKRTPMRVAVLIAAVWIVSGVISVPPLLGWRDEMASGNYPLCEVSRRIGYVIYSSMGSFFIPVIVIVFVYFRVYVAARTRARQGVRMRTAETTTVTSFRNNSQQQAVVGKPPCKNADRAYVIDAPVAKPETEAETLTQINGVNVMNYVPEEATRLVDKNDVVAADPPVGDDDARTNKYVPLPTVAKSPKRKPAFFARIAIVHSPLISSRKRANTGSSEDLSKDPTKNADRQKRRIARARERRATIVIGIIIAAFILCWLPFGFVYVTEALCDHCRLPPLTFSIFFFLGYCNSALNPIIYTVFNRDFSNAFKRMLGCGGAKGAASY